MTTLQNRAPAPQALTGYPVRTTPALIKSVLAAYSATGATDEILTAVRLLLARGTIFETAVDLASDADRDFLDCLDATARMVANRQSLKPIVAAIKAEQAVRHYPWCSDACLVNRYDDGTVSVEHIGPKLKLAVPAGMDVREGDLVSSFVGHDEELEDGPTVFLSSGNNGVPLNADQLDKFLEDLDAFRDELRAQRAQLNEERQA